MASPNKKKRDKRMRINQPIDWFSPVCKNCGRVGSHYMPPSLNDKGGFICDFIGKEK